MREDKSGRGDLMPPRWGQPGAPLVPSQLRAAWSGEGLPQWVCRELDLPKQSTFAALDSSALKETTCEQRLRSFVVNRMCATIPSIATLRAIPGWPSWLRPEQVQWRRRTRNCLINARLLRDLERLSNMTFQDLLSLSQMGPISVLDFACATEAAIEHGEPPSIDKDEDIDTSILAEVIDQEWATQISDRDPRFSDLFSPEDLTALERVDLLTRQHEENSSALCKLACQLGVARDRVRHLNELPLDMALRDFLQTLSRAEGVRLDALSARMGWTGSPPVTLAAAGEMAGITRERIRQLEERIRARLPNHPVFMPRLDAALELIARRAPLDLDEAAQCLRTAGITNVPFDPRSLLAVAKACNRTPTFHIETIRKRTRVVTTPLGRLATRVMSIAYRQAGASGASNIQELVAEAVEIGIECDEEEVRNILRIYSKVEFLDSDWFWHPDGKPERSRLRNLTRKMLSVVNPLDLALLRDGLRREYSFRGSRGVSAWPITVPPRSILGALYDRHPEFVIAGSSVSSQGELDWRTELRETERVLVESLLEAPSKVLDRASCVRTCSRRGLNENTLSIYLSYSGLIVHLGLDVWSLRGIEVDPATVEVVRQFSRSNRSKSRRVLDHGWTSDGRLWAAARVPEFSSNFVFGIPRSIRGYLPGREFPAVDEEGHSCGVIGLTEEGTSYGYGAFLRRRGADVGDVLMVEFDLVARTVILRLVDDEGLEKALDWSTD